MDYKELKEQKVLLKQIKNLTTIVEQLKLNPLLSMDGEQNFEIIGDLQFSEKEIRKMPRLKDFKIRIMKGKYYEIRFRRYGYDMSFSSKSLDVAKQKAFAWLKMFEQEIQMNHNFAVVREVGKTANKKNTIFGPFALSYMENVKKRMVKANTYQNLCNAFKLHILAKFKSVPIKEITPIVLQTYLSKLHDEKPRLCETIKTLLNNIFDYAVNNEIITKNPIKAVYIPKHYRTTGQALTRQEEKEFVKKIKGHRFEETYLKMLYSGVRPCEINTIEESLLDETIKIENGKLKNYQKNKHRILPMFPMYKPYATGKPKKVSQQKLGDEFSELCPNHTLKDLRHTFTTRARECGVDNELVAVWTGHSLGNITSSVYTHFSIEFQKEQAQKLIYTL